jgi:hypothetical protein
MTMPTPRRHCCESSVKQIHAPGCVYAPQAVPGVYNEAMADQLVKADAKIANSGIALSSVLEEAEGLIYGDRKEQYGNAAKNFGDIAHLWEPILGVRPSAEAVALCLLQLKVARAINDIRAGKDIKRDTIVDLAGYAGCIEKIQKGL